MMDNAHTLDDVARRHLWLHFTDHSEFADSPVPMIVRGEGAYIFDQNGRRYLDGISGLLVTQLGHGRTELVSAAAKQAQELAFFPLWSFAHPTAVELAGRIADAAPGDLNRVFFTSGGSEAVESAWKLAKLYFKLTGKPSKTKVISRAGAYHGTTHGALSITGIPSYRQPYEPLVPGVVRAPNTDFYRSQQVTGDLAVSGDEEAFGRWAAEEVGRLIEREGADTVAAVFVEPVQNSGGCLTPPPGYFARLREICDTYDVLLVSDEVICGYGRLGTMFGCQKFGYLPDIITSAKGLTSGYSPIGAMIASDRLFEPFASDGTIFTHGYTFGGHPVSAAVALANLDIFEREGILEHVTENEPVFRSILERLYDLPIVGDVRGAGYFFGVELVKDKDKRTVFTAEECDTVLGGRFSQALLDAGLYCRTAGDQGDRVVQLAPPLICGEEHFEEIEAALRTVLSEAWKML
ncbi:aspartate aminotransferase family protein [Actinacidiphila bryophytorum]|jgi:adenosylmethionine-8-amino-7-oxononanoate aminotransferase|uniref:Omega-amino acid--pyruvate aminotransferase n=1 Tax=Actinacidiphila bryophytorum TaxID=1436133 RepID=A0A9W4H5B9_9ACTN|nr:aspartate aminotransferase family protein [Actinacidiphila bryophytorum]CAG7651779.1 Omega-amino acid--pyruvate aminotransferase [Actinacidiphila bryophytorum]